eukprot:scaffold65219_cov60-Phaeocystis_antarctica.AAC.5
MACLHAECATSKAQRPSASVSPASEAVALTALPSQSAWSGFVRISLKNRSTTGGFARRKACSWPGPCLKRVACIACLHAECATSKAQRPSSSVSPASEGVALTASPSQSAWSGLVRISLNNRNTTGGFASKKACNRSGACLKSLKRASCIRCLHSEWATSKARRPSASVSPASEGVALTASPSQSAWAASVRMDLKKSGTASGLASRNASSWSGFCIRCLHAEWATSKARRPSASVSPASEGVALTASPSQLAWAASVRMVLKKAGTASGLASRKACSWPGASLRGSTMRRGA